MKRCGLSWVIYTLSAMHKEMYGVPIQYQTLHKKVYNKPNFKVPESYGLRNKMKKGWGHQYNLDPIRLIKAGYDHVVIIQRDYMPLYEAYKIFLFEETFIQKGRVDINWNYADFKKLYDDLYRKDIVHPKLIRMRLEDLNNYTVSSFHKLMDFLGFKKEGRPKMIPIAPPERYWQVRSSILPKGHRYSRRLEFIKDNREEIEKMMEITRGKPINITKEEYND